MDGRSNGLLTFGLVFLLLQLVCGQPEVLEWIASVQVPTEEDVIKLIKAGISLHNPKRGATVVEAYISPNDVHLLDDLEFSYNLIPNENLRILHKQKRDGAMQYHNYVQLTAALQNISTTYPNITKLFSLGKSVQGRDIWAMEVSRNPGVNEAEPEFKYIANMHGDEVVGREMLLTLIQLLCSSYGTDDRLTKFVNSIDIFIVPTMNPDGFERGTRANANGRDINRDFPDQFSAPNKQLSACQPEVKAIMSWTLANHFVLSANFHGGSVVANYPFDGNANYQSGRYSAAPDDKVFKDIALVYSTNHLKMKYSSEFPNGITNGADWYVLYGGMQDWNYLWNGVFELTIELSDIKWPSANTLSGFWNDNKASLLDYMELVLTMGVRGIVTDASTQKPLAANITVTGINSPAIRTDPQNGDYYRLLTPNTYTITASAIGYRSSTASVIVASGVQSVKNFQLQSSS